MDRSALPEIVVVPAGNEAMSTSSEPASTPSGPSAMSTSSGSSPSRDEKSKQRNRVLAKKSKNRSKEISKLKAELSKEIESLSGTIAKENDVLSQFRPIQLTAPNSGSQTEEPLEVRDENRGTKRKRQALNDLKFLATLKAMVFKWTKMLPELDKGSAEWLKAVIDKSDTLINTIDPNKPAGTKRKRN